MQDIEIEKAVTGWAPVNRALTPEQREANEAAAKAFVALSGGFEGMLANGTKLADLSWIVEADPEDDLSGLRLFAERLIYDHVAGAQRQSDPEIELTPYQAKVWLIKSARAREIDGSLVLNNDEQSHLSLAGFTIATGETPRLLSEVYLEVTDSVAALDPSLIANVARIAIQGTDTEY